jgi:hypothetical protein
MPRLPSSPGTASLRFNNIRPEALTLKAAIPQIAEGAGSPPTIALALEPRFPASRIFKNQAPARYSRLSAASIRASNAGKCSSLRWRNFASSTRTWLVSTVLIIPDFARRII